MPQGLDRSAKVLALQQADANTNGFATRAGTVILALTLTLYVVGAIRLCCLPFDQFCGQVIVDDAVYYVIPAENWLAGKGYSFDGEHRSSGVQPLWAIIATGLTALVPTRVLTLRLLVLLSAALWAVAGVLLYRTLRRFHRALALFVTVGWLLTAFWNRLALQGMENGLHGLLLVLLVHFGVCHLRSARQTPDADRAGFYVGLGALTALLTLARIESGVLAVVLGLLVGLSLVRPGSPPVLQLNWRAAVLFTVPLFLLVGGWCLLSRLYFGTFTPLSGRVKLFYEDSAAPLYGSAVGALNWHVRHMFNIATWPLVGNTHSVFSRILAVAVSLKYLRCGLLLVLAGGWICAVVVLIRRWWRREVQLSAWHVYVAGLALFVLIRFAMLALLLPHYTRYGSWYFTPEVLGMWILLGVAALTGSRVLVAPVGLVRRWRVASVRHKLASAALGGLAAGMLLLATWPVWSAAPALRGGPANRFVVAGRWLNEYLPAGQRVGAFSSGLLSYAAPNHQIINLDGLMNNLTYYEQYLRRGWGEGVPDYIRDEGIAYFADYFPNHVWRDGFPVQSMQLLRWWPLGRSAESIEESESYGIWRILPEGQPLNVLGPCAPPCSQMERIQFAAEVLGQYPVVEENELSCELSSQPASALRVVTSIVEAPSGRLRHVLMPIDEARCLPLSPEQLHMSVKVNAIFDETFELLGAHIHVPTVQRGARFAWTLYWRVVDDASKPDATVIETWIHPSDPAACAAVPPARVFHHSTAGCHGTYPISSWKSGEIISETVSMCVPAAMPPGRYPLMVGVRDARSGWLAPKLGSSQRASRVVFIANIEIW